MGTRGSSCKLLHTSKDTRSLAKNTRRQASYTQTCQKRQTVLCFMILIQLHPSLHIASRHSINAQESFLWDQTSYKSRNLLFCIFQESNEILVRIHELLLSCLKFEVKLLPSFEIVPRVLTDQRNEESAIDTPDKSNPTQLRNLRIVRYKL